MWAGGVGGTRNRSPDAQHTLSSPEPVGWQASDVTHSKILPLIKKGCHHFILNHHHGLHNHEDQNLAMACPLAAEGPGAVVQVGAGVEVAKWTPSPGTGP